MADITWSDVTDTAPELATLAVNAQTLILDYVNSALNVTVFDGEEGPRTKAARVYLAAHLATMTTRANANASGPKTNASLGPQSKKYSEFKSDFASQYNATSYGMLYSLMVNTSSARGPIIL